MTKVLKLQLTFNELEFPASMIPLLGMPPHFRSRFCKQVLELYFREGGEAGGAWPARRTTSTAMPSEVTGTSADSASRTEARSPLDPEMFNDSFASYF